MRKFTCPRRIEDGRADEDSVFHYDGKNIDLWQDGQTCSYCGSIRPKILFDAIEAGGKITPTDKNYKIYVEVEGMRSNSKFYFQHLSVPERKQFVELMNNKKINFDEPGHFYVRPFFVAPPEQSRDNTER